MKVAVIGAGMAGLSCAQRLRTAGIEVEVFEKSRGLGGRMATRWLGDLVERRGFDHGAPYFTARHPAFIEILNDLQAARSVAVWDAMMLDCTGSAEFPPVPRPTRQWVGTPGMTSVAKSFGQGLKVHLQTRVLQITRSVSGQWTLNVNTQSGQARLPEWDAVVLAVPAEQAADLLPSGSSLSSVARGVVSVPYWNVMLELAQPLVTGFDLAELPAVGVLQRVVRDSAKPGRAVGERWVLQTTRAWSEHHIEAGAVDVATLVLEAFDAFLLSLGHAGLVDTPPPLSLNAHRWLYASPAKPLERTFVWDDAEQLAVCGDWLKGTDVESAFLSGRALGEALSAYFLA
jgi:hypothetical protein